jgi:hypothetical protein
MVNYDEFKENIKEDIKETLAGKGLEDVDIKSKNYWEYKRMVNYLNSQIRVEFSVKHVIL